MHHARTYSYDDQSGTGYLPSQYPQQYARGYQSPQGSGQYYVQPGDNMEAPESSAYYRSMTPMVSSTDRYTASGHQQYYQSSSNGSTSSQADPSAYHTQSPYYASQYQRSQTPAIQNHEATQFIPTPSELYVYSPRQISMPAQASSADPYTSTPFTTAHAFVPSSRSPEQRPSRIATGRPMTSPGSPITSPSDLMTASATMRLNTFRLLLSTVAVTARKSLAECSE
ncbi:hypothetical protein H0H93_011108 [Arthromyces matolae]|nr:hypothetical protein H0H93_011108 [Arthromyces matolae]